jgi:hypothetical protein
VEVINPGMTTWVKDSVHGDIPLTPVAESLLDTPEMQRLRRIRQTAFGSLIYPGANHSRFEHSLGVYYLTSRACFFQGWNDREAELLAVAALLHDVGHSAFSHALEGVVHRALGKDHEEITNERIRSGEIRRVLEGYEIGPDEVIRAFESPRGKVVTGDLGTDRMDYLMRDALFTGVTYDTVDTDRLLRKLILENGKLVLDASAISAAESMLLSRFMMFTTVYGHHASIAANTMLERAVERAIRDGVISAEDVSATDDATLMLKLQAAGGYAADIAQRLLERRIFKRAVRVPLRDVKNWLYLGNMEHEQKLEIESKIAAEAGIPEGYVILDIPKPFFGELSVTVKKENDYYALGELSLISRILKEAQLDYTHVCLFTPKEHVDRLSPASLKALESI